jgi:hypothetical protein
MRPGSTSVHDKTLLDVLTSTIRDRSFSFAALSASGVVGRQRSSVAQVA